MRTLIAAHSDIPRREIDANGARDRCDAERAELSAVIVIWRAEVRVVRRAVANADHRDRVRMRAPHCRGS
jgi:hypothetical protein